jgi:isopentenyl-diphosphate delta-isomerase
MRPTFMPNHTKKIILVDKKDREIGTVSKLKAHKEGKLHRAFSIFIFNRKKELLLQKRSSKKYHSGGLWTNTCCSHPRSGELTESAVHRRLQEEMGFDCRLSEIFSFIYKVKLSDKLTEHEFDHVFIGTFNWKPVVNVKEVEDFKWVSFEFLKNDIRKNPMAYSYWFKKCYKRVFEKLQ